LKPLDLPALGDILRKAVTRHAGWPVFWAPQQADIAPREVDGTIECWLARDRDSDAGRADFWRAAPDGRFFLIRGYQEDGQETFSPRTIMDTTRPRPCCMPKNWRRWCGRMTTAA
jgi:transcriptional regulator with XRE-family HTH domain